MERAASYLSPQQKNRTSQSAVEADTGYRTPEMSKTKKEALKTRHEAIGTMSSFFKRTIAAKSHISDDSCLDDRWASRISSFSSSLKRSSCDLVVSEHPEGHESIMKPFTKVKMCKTNLQPENRIEEKEPSERDPHKKIGNLVNRCETCSEKTRFSRAIFECCDHKHLCLRCYDIFSRQQSAAELVCPFCGKTDISVKQIMTGLFSMHGSNASQVSNGESHVYFPKSICSDEAISM